MTASDQLNAAYAEWRRLAEEEGEAIQRADWTAVQVCQEALHELQAEILRCTQEARAEWLNSGRDVAAEENRLRAIIGELIEIGRRNNSLLDGQRTSAQAQLDQLQQTGQTLRQVQRSYSPPRDSVWSSFS